VKIVSTQNSAEPYCVTQINTPQFMLKINGKKLTTTLALADATVTEPSGVTNMSFILADPVNVTCPDILINGVAQTGFQLVFMPPP
jgi:hypothetical protein